MLNRTVSSGGTTVLKPRTFLLALLVTTPAMADIVDGYYVTQLLPPTSLGDCNPASDCPVAASAINNNGWVIGTFIFAGVSPMAALWEVSNPTASSAVGTWIVDPFTNEVNWAGLGVSDNGDLLLFHGGADTVPCSQPGGGGYVSSWTVIHAGGGPSLNPNDCQAGDAELLSSLSEWTGPIGPEFGGFAENSFGQYIETYPEDGFLLGTADLYTPVADVPEPSSLLSLGTALCASLAVGIWQKGRDRGIKRRHPASGNL